LTPALRSFLAVLPAREAAIKTALALRQNRSVAGLAGRRGGPAVGSGGVQLASSSLSFGLQVFNLKPNLDNGLLIDGLWRIVGVNGWR
jgi:hypothetical protein